MKILVCISHVPDTTSKIDFVDDREFDTSGISFVINPYDEFGLTKSVFIKENNGANITVLCVGDSSCESSLRKALAIGADEAVRIDHIPKDSLNVAKLIYDYIKDKEYDLIITGRESIDYNSGVVPGLISKMLNIPFVNACIGLDIKDNVVHLKREIDVFSTITLFKKRFGSGSFWASKRTKIESKKRANLVRLILLVRSIIFNLKNYI